jgi:hypothetical protein
MRQHVNLAEHALDQLVGRGGMCQHRPIGARNVAALHRVVPECRDRGSVLRLGALIERHLVTAIERLLKMLGARPGTADQLDPKLMDTVIVGRLRTIDIEPQQDRAQLCRGQASADDGTVQAMMEIPDPRSLPRWLLDSYQRRPPWQQSTDLARLLDRVRQNGRQNGRAI